MKSVRTSNATSITTLCVLITTVLLTLGTTESPQSAKFSTPPSQVKNTLLENNKPHYSVQLVSDGSTALVHAASATQLSNNNLLAVWFAGSREGARDVTIHAARYSTQQQQWRMQEPIATPAQTQQDLQRYTKKLGNAVIFAAPDSRVWLFYVSVSLGGWATSSINFQISEDQGETWSSARKLISSPFLNLSTLVKGTPYAYDDGSIALPIYHELAGKFGELLRISADGKVLQKSRITTGRTSLQPVLFPLNNSQSLALLRNAGQKPHKVLLAQSNDGGHSWHAIRTISIDNPNSALTGLVDQYQRLWIVANDLPNGRQRLSLAVSEDQGKTWTTVFRFEDKNYLSDHKLDPDQFANIVHDTILKPSPAALTLVEDANAVAETISQHAAQRMCQVKGCKFKYDYPYLINSDDGNYHLLYTWNGSYIKHIQFNQAWLETLL